MRTQPPHRPHRTTLCRKRRRGGQRTRHRGTRRTPTGVNRVRRMFHSIDAWLWRRGIDHPAVRALLRNEILLTALALLGGGLLFAVTPWVFWFGVGLAVMAWTFWCLARFFLRRGLGDYSTAFLRIVIGALAGPAGCGGRDSVRRPGPLGRAAPGSAERHGHGLRLCAAQLRSGRARTGQSRTPAQINFANMSSQSLRHARSGA